MQLDLFAGGPHVASGTIVSESEGWTYQPCAVCGTPLVGHVTGTGGLLDTYTSGALVGFGCPGKKTRRKRDDDDV